MTYNRYVTAKGGEQASTAASIGSLMCTPTGESSSIVLYGPKLNGTSACHLNIELSVLRNSGTQYLFN